MVLGIAADEAEGLAGVVLAAGRMDMLSLSARGEGLMGSCLGDAFAVAGVTSIDSRREDLNLESMPLDGVVGCGG